MASRKRSPKSQAKPARVWTPTRAAASEDEIHPIEILVARKQWYEAQERLEALLRKYPADLLVIVTLLDVYAKLGDSEASEQLCLSALRLAPDTPALIGALAGAYLQNDRPALALQTYRRFLALAPKDETAAQVRNIVEQLQTTLPQVLQTIGLSGEGAEELAALHEEAQSLLDRGEYAQARRVEQRLLERAPQFAPALNNISLSYFAEEQAEKAIATAQSTLEFAPGNIHALSNLVRFCCLMGRVEEARQYADRLRASTDLALAKGLKVAEGLSYLGDDAGVLEAFESARADQAEDPSWNTPLLHHLAAVAAWRMGRKADARRYWKKALSIDPEFEWARANLEDLRQPPAEQHAPWPFDINNWVMPSLLQSMDALFGAAEAKGGDEAFTKAARTYLRRHPHVLGMAPLLLDHGDLAGREFACRLAQIAETPESIAILREYALSARGPDALRIESAQVVMRAGELAPGTLHMWIRGKWTDVTLFGFEIHDDPIYRHPPKVEALMREAMALQRARKFGEAEALLQQALAVEPDAPDILNNLATVFGNQGRTEELEEIIQQIYEKHPDYLFARTNLAHIALRQHDIATARSLLEPLLKRRRLHVSELAAICSTQIELFIAEGDREAARGWFDMWSQADPGHPLQTPIRARLALSRWKPWHR